MEQEMKNMHIFFPLSLVAGKHAFSSTRADV